MPHGIGCAIPIFCIVCLVYHKIQNIVYAKPRRAIMNKQLPCCLSHPVMPLLHHLRVEEDHSDHHIIWLSSSCIAYRRVGWQSFLKLSRWSVFPLWLITSLSEVLYHPFLLSETLTHGCLLWHRLLTGRYSWVSTNTGPAANTTAVARHSGMEMFTAWLLHYIKFPVMVKLI